MSSKKNVKQFSYIAIGNTIGGAIQGIFYIAFALILQPEDYGLMVFIIALAGTVSLFSRFGLPFTSVVYNGKNEELRVNQCHVLTLILTGVGALILLPINQYAALLCIGLSLFVINLQDLIGRKRYKKYFITYMIKTISIITIPFLLYYFFDIYGIIIGMAIGNLLGSYNFIFSLKRKINGFRELKSDYKILVHNFSVDASSNLSRSIDKIVIVPFFGLVPVALYQFNLQIMLIVGILPFALYSFLLSEESSGKKHSKISLLVIFSSIIISIAIVLFSPYVLSEFFPKFVDGVLGLQIIIFSIIPMSINSILNAKLQASKSTKVGIAAIAKIVSLILLLIILGMQFELIGFSLAVLCSTCIETILLSLFYKQQKSASSM
ncbi:oligosaccharide flippase family protein [Nitrosopumilus sp.]|uniref:oligosaccharide flippase family protein n=1 Tax=Nitrosopumilus sp. TaxID=2024843 RepID=UPI00262ACB32|nr:oligosaccharide flippase family protein [Nitrosopumilus sp.]